MRCTSSADRRPASRLGAAVVAGCLGSLLLTSTACRRPPSPEPESGPSGASLDHPVAAPEAVAGEPVPLPLRQGAEVPRRLAGGQVDEFLVDLEAGQFLQLVIEQQGVDVVSTLSDPDGQLILQVDGPTADQESEELLAVAATTGRYRVRVRAWGASDAGDYTLRIESPRAADAHDREKASAARVFSAAELLRAGGSESAAAAIGEYREAARRFRALGDRSGEGAALRGLGRVYQEVLGRDEAAAESYRRALPIVREVGDLWQEARICDELGRIQFEDGDLESAAELFRRAIDLWQQLARSRGAARTECKLGKLYQQLGRAQDALTLFERALAHWREYGETSEIATTLFLRGESFRQLGKYREALDDFERALSIWQESGAYRWQMTALKSISQIHERQGRLDLALAALDRAWEPIRKIEDPRAEALLWNAMGILQHRAGRYDEARDAYEQALEGLRRAGDRTAEGVVLHNIGNNRLILGDPCAATGYYRRALGLFDAVLGPESVTYKQTTTLLGLAKAERRCNGSSDARALFEKALGMLEELRSSTASLDYRSSFLATQAWFYDEYVDFLMDLHALEPLAGHDAEALAISERARARSLLDGLAESGADLRRGADPELIREERELTRQLQAIEQHSPSFDRADAVDGGSFDEQLRNAQVKKRAILRRLSEIQARVHLESPRYETLTTPRPLDAAEIRSRVLDPDTLLLEYDLGEERSHLWALTPQDLISFELPAGAVIERQAREAYKLLKLSRRRRSTARVEMVLSELGEMLLGPVSDLLPRSLRLLIVSEGALQYLPFAALTIPGSAFPILVEHEVVNMPSASAMAILRQQLADRPPAPASLAVIADPVFQSYDPRVGAPGTGGTVPPLRGAGLEASPGGPERLVYSQHEAQAILQYFPAVQTKVLLGFEATREAVIDGDLGRYRILHFATHGVLDEEHPELSRLVLSLVDEAGRQRDSGLLFGHEIYNLDLPVELVVLSACETALGKEIRGEGLVGLTQSFFYAGAARVLVSLWNVDDYATAELMSRFYRFLMEDEMRPAAALRQAQLDLWRRTPAPYYWAAFMIRGEWR
jgi:CHAT domain-containing protein/tetratricopeptide (TPR) repeat protein